MEGFEGVVTSIHNTVCTIITLSFGNCLSQHNVIDATGDCCFFTFELEIQIIVFLFNVYITLDKKEKKNKNKKIYVFICLFN